MKTRDRMFVTVVVTAAIACFAATALVADETGAVGSPLVLPWGIDKSVFISANPNLFARAGRVMERRDFTGVPATIVYGFDDGKRFRRIDAVARSTHLRNPSDHLVLFFRWKTNLAAKLGQPVDPQCPVIDDPAVGRVEDFGRSRTDLSCTWRSGNSVVELRSMARPDGMWTAVLGAEEGAFSPFDERTLMLAEPTREEVSESGIAFALITYDWANDPTLRMLNLLLK